MCNGMVACQDNDKRECENMGILQSGTRTQRPKRPRTQTSRSPLGSTSHKHPPPKTMTTRSIPFSIYS